jgi:hypothetical protein
MNPGTDVISAWIQKDLKERIALLCGNRSILPCAVATLYIYCDWIWEDGYILEFWRRFIEDMCLGGLYGESILPWYMWLDNHWISSPYIYTSLWILALMWYLHEYRRYSFGGSRWRVIPIMIRCQHTLFGRVREGLLPTLSVVDIYD